MKKIIIMVICMAYTIAINSQEVYYYYNNEKISFETNYQQMNLWVKGSNIDDIKRILESKYTIVSTENQIANANIISFDKSEKIEYTLVNLKAISPIESNSALEIQKKLNSISSLVYSSFAIKNNSKVDRFFSNQIYVKLKSELDIEKLKIEALKYKTTILGSNEFMPLWITLLCDKNSIGTSNEIANAIFVTKLFEVAEPDILNNFEPHCTNDPNFGSQWFLNNTGQSSGTAGVDIKACNAWQINTGNPNIITAVIDEGFEMNHPDLQNNVIGTGFNTKTGTSPSVVFGPHGTQCAGLVSAQGNNNLGVSGVAPNSRIMSISMDFGTLTNQQIASGIDFAWKNGASILSNSWGGGSSTAIITDAIKRALDSGRNMLGSVVVFSAGNNNVNGAEFPSNSDARIICVGAIDRCGTRSGRANVISNSCDPWCANCRPASSFGDPLDIVAGGTNTHTTDQQGTAGDASGDYDPNFGGTSAACPIVAGVASLILSVNPCLKQSSVHDIICKSGQKLSLFTFAPPTASFRPLALGSWNNEVGHGHVNAEACVNMASRMYLQKQNESANKNYLYRKIEAGKNVDPLTAVGDYNIISSGDVTLRATESITLKDGFHSNYGTTFSARIEPNAPCNHTNPILKLARINEPNNSNSSTNNTSQPLISAYPNPTNDVLKINFETIQSSKIAVSIFDIQGKQVFSENFTKDIGIYNEEIAGFRSLQNATYILKVCINSNCQSFRIIKDETR